MTMIYASAKYQLCVTTPTPSKFLKIRFSIHEPSTLKFDIISFVTVRPFFAPLLTQEKNRVRTAEEGHGTTFECIFMYLFLGLYIQRLFLVIVGTLLF
jgi:hypothetical protein